MDARRGPRRTCQTPGSAALSGFSGRGALKPGGRLFATFFLLDETSLRSIDEGDSDIDFRHPWDLGLLMSEEKPEDAVAYRAEWVFETLDGLGLDVRRPPHYGAWSGRPGALDYQDVVVADRR